MTNDRSLLDRRQPNPLLGLWLGLSMLPLTLRRGGATLVGVAVALAAYFLVTAVFPSAATGFVGAGLVGGIVGFVLWRPPHIEPAREDAG